MSDETVRTQAMEFFEQLKNKHWSTFFREVFGLGGIIHQAYPTTEEITKFRQTSAYQDVLCMLVTLWEESGHIAGGEHRAVITLRVPQSLHDLLKEEAHSLHTTINGLCIAKLISDINPDLVPKVM